MLFLKKKEKIRIPLPYWLLPAIMAVWCESLLHIWTSEFFIFGRFVAVLIFALSFGGVLSLICSFFPNKAGKWAAGIISGFLVVLFMAEYLIHDAFQNFMGFGTMQAGAAGVMDTYLGVVLRAIARSWWRILLVVLPMVLFLIFVKPDKERWLVRGVIALATALFFGCAFGTVYGAGLDKDKLKDSYTFDGAVNAFGLHTALVLDAFAGSGIGNSDLEFEIPDVTEVPETTEAELPEETQAPTTQPDETTEPTEETEPPIVYYEHTLGLDFAALSQSEPNSNVANMHKYVASLKPAMEHQYTGLFEGKNLIFITAEAFTGVVIDPELTPTLYRLATKGIEFTNYYQPVWGAGTTGGEYSNVVGHVPVDGKCMREAIHQDLFLTIGNQLQDRGYSSAAFHNNSHTYYNRHETHTYLGYDYFMGHGNGIEEGVAATWPESDLEMIDFTVPLYIDKQPFSVYYMSVSGHSNYSRGSNAMSKKNYDKVAHLDCSEAIKCYLAANLELENALTSLLAQLEAAGIMDDTVIVIAADHYPYGLESSTTWGTDTNYLKELFGVKKINELIRDQNQLIIWSGAIEDMEIQVDAPTFSLDVLPTLLNLFGVEYDSRLFVGRDVLSDEDPLVFWISGSWITDKGTYLSSKGEFVPVEGVEIPKGYVDQIKTIVRNKIKFSKGITYYNYFNYVVEALESLNSGQ